MLPTLIVPRKWRAQKIQTRTARSPKTRGMKISPALSKWPNGAKTNWIIIWNSKKDGSTGGGKRGTARLWKDDIVERAVVAVVASMQWNYTETEPKTQAVVGIIVCVFPRLKNQGYGSLAPAATRFIAFVSNFPFFVVAAICLHAMKFQTDIFSSRWS